MPDPRTLTPSECTRDAWRASLLETHVDIDPDALDTALSLLSVHGDRYRWYSEDHPNMSAADVESAVAAWQKLGALLEEAVPNTRPIYEYAWHPIADLMASARMIWLWFEDPSVAPILERIAAMSDTRKTPSGLLLIPKSEMRRTEESGSGLWLNTQFTHLHWFLLGEIAGAAGNPSRALACFERFLDFESDFAPLCDYVLDDEFYYLKRYLPSSVDAYRRAGLAAEGLGLATRAEELYRKALALRHTHQTPFVELAMLLRKRGKDEEAARLELERAETLAHGYSVLRQSFDLPRIFGRVAQQFVERGIRRWPAIASGGPMKCAVRTVDFET